MAFRRKSFRSKDLEIVRSSEDFRRANEKPIGVGDVMRLNSGGPAMLVVDLDAGSVTVAWRNASKIEEASFPEPCVHRICDLW